MAPSTPTRSGPLLTLLSAFSRHSSTRPGGPMVLPFIWPRRSTGQSSTAFRGGGTVAPGRAVTRRSPLPCAGAPSPSGSCNKALINILKTVNGPS